MKVKVLFFGVLSELCETSSLELEATDVAALLATLELRFPEMKAHKFRVSLNQNFTNENVALANGDEVALLPPFAGG